MIYICSNARSGSNLITYFIRQYQIEPIEITLLHNLYEEIPLEDKLVLTVIRDYRDAIFSFSKLMGFELNEENILHSACEYGKQLRNFFELPNKHHIIYYEDLINKFVPTVMSIVNFLNLEMDKEKILNLQYLISTKGKQETYDNIYKKERGFVDAQMSPASSISIGKWKNYKIFRQKLLKNKIIGNIVAELGVTLYEALISHYETDWGTY